ncbi:MAG TPA: hypothetical protein VKE40_17890 [Gemmataceae bacterium]|nr:hypothetical protein [Gemmataceae bacterium]
MATATLGNTLSEILANAKERIVIRAPDGRVVGYFEPLDDQDDDSCPYTEEQILEFQRDKGVCRPLGEVLKRIGAE